MEGKNINEKQQHQNGKEHNQNVLFIFHLQDIN
jgi:hypothetical protein